MRALVGELGADVDLLSRRHLLPTARGILATMTVPLTRALDDVMEPWRPASRTNRSSSSWTPAGVAACESPQCRRIHATPAAHVARRPLVFSAIDNLMKALPDRPFKNANLMLGSTKQWASRVMRRVVKSAARAIGSRASAAIASAVRAGDSVCLVHGGGDESRRCSDVWGWSRSSSVAGA